MKYLLSFYSVRHYSGGKNTTLRRIDREVRMMSGLKCCVQKERDLVFIILRFTVCEEDRHFHHQKHEITGSSMMKKARRSFKKKKKIAQDSGPLAWSPRGQD